MIPRIKTTVLAAALAAAGAAAASAELSLESVRWQAGRVEGARVKSWQDVKSLADAPKPADHMRALLVLKNDGSQSEEGLLLRYSLIARVLPSEGGPAEGSWGVPFAIDEKRVPKVGAEKTVEVPIDAGASIDLCLRRLARAGWRPDRLKIQVMLEPHRASRTLQVVEDVLEVGGGMKRL